MRVLTGLIRPDAGGAEDLGQPVRSPIRKPLLRLGASSRRPRSTRTSPVERLAGADRRGCGSPAGRWTSHHGLNTSLIALPIGTRRSAGHEEAAIAAPSSMTRPCLLDGPANGLDPAGIVAMRPCCQTCRRGKAASSPSTSWPRSSRWPTRRRSSPAAASSAPGSATSGEAGEVRVTSTHRSWPTPPVPPPGGGCIRTATAPAG